MIAPSILSTSRLLLRRPLASDTDAVFAFASDPLVVRYMDWPAAVEPADVMRVAERALQQWDSGGEYSSRLTLPPDDTPIGSIGCRIVGEAADFGFVLGGAPRRDAFLYSWTRAA